MSGKSEKKEHQKKIIGLSRKGLILTVIAAVAVGASITIGLNRVYMQSSTDESCQSCHVHPQADKSWKLSSHHNSKSGVVTGCAECHLPPKGSFKHFTAKARTGLKDLWAYWTKDSSEFDWESKKNWTTPSRSSTTNHARSAISSCSRRGSVRKVSPPLSTTKKTKRNSTCSVSAAIWT